MRVKNTTSILYLILVFTFLLTACSDDSTSSLNSGEPPQIPNTVPMEIDNSIFADAEAPFEEEYEGFHMAKSLVETANTLLFGFANSGNVYLKIVENSDPEYIDGLWFWEFTHEQGSDYLTVKTTAERVNGDVEWIIYLSGSIAEFGDDFEEYMYARGIIEEDGSTGEWNYYAPESTQNAIYSYVWSHQSDTDFQINSLYSYEEQEFFVNFKKENADNHLEFLGFEDDRETIVYWNSDTREGYVDNGEERRCWGEDFSEEAC